MGDEPANRDAGEVVEQREHGIEDLAADVLEVDVDPLGQASSGRSGKIGCAVVEAGIEAELVQDVGALLPRPRRCPPRGSP